LPQVLWNGGGPGPIPPLLIDAVFAAGLLLNSMRPPRAHPSVAERTKIWNAESKELVDVLDDGFQGALARNVVTAGADSVMRIVPLAGLGRK
jgi:hypothetical protein